MKKLLFALVVLAGTAFAQVQQAGITRYIQQPATQPNPSAGTSYLYVKGNVLVCQNSDGSSCSVPTPASSGLCLVSTGSTAGAWTFGSCSGSTSTNVSALVADAPNTSGGTFQIGNGTTWTTTGTGVINANQLGGKTFAVPAAIGSTTPAAGTFTALTANTSITDAALGAGVVHSSSGGLFSSSVVTNAELQNSATTVNGQTCTLGSTCTIPEQVNTVNMTSQAGFNLLTSTVNAVGLTVTPTNSATNQLKFEITGASYTGNAATATTAGNVTGTVDIPNGGTNATTKAAAFNNLAPAAAAKGALIVSTAANTYGTVAYGVDGQCLVGVSGQWAPGACATGSVGAGAGLTTGVIPKATASLTLGNSNLSESGTVLTYAGSISLPTSAAPTGSAGSAWLWYDTTATRVQSKQGNNTAVNLVISGVDINTSDQVTATHLTSPLPAAQGGCATSVAALTGLIRGGNPCSAAELSGDATTSGSNAVTVTKINGTSLAGLATGILKNTTSTGVPSIAVAGDFPTLNQNTTGSAAKWTTARNLAGNSVDGSANVAFSNKFVVQGTTDTGLSGAQFLGALATGIVKNTTTTGVLSIAVAGDFPTLNQNTTGTAAGWTTARNLAGNSVDGTANVAFANKFIVQGTTDSGLSGAQFLGALATGLVKNTTTTGVLSIAASSDVTALWTGTCNSSTYLRGDGACNTPPGTLSGLGNTQVVVATGATTATSYAGFTSDSSGNVTAASYTSSSSGAGIFYLGQGTAQSLGTNAIGFMAPTSVTSYNFVPPGAPSSGFIKWTNVSGIVTGVFDAAINFTGGADITGVCPVANGCTGNSSLTQYNAIVGNGTSAVTLVPPIAGGVFASSSASANPGFTATPTLGNLTTTVGTITLDTGANAGAITISPGTTNTTWTLILPTTHGTNGFCLKASGSDSTATTWASCGGGGSSAWDTLTAPTTSNLSLSMASFTTAFTYGDQGASASTPLFTVTDSASTSTDRSLNLVADTGGSSNHVPFVARYRGSDALKVCPSVGSATGTAVVGAVIACETINSVNATPIAKFLVESATNAHVTARFYQNGAGQTGTSVEIFTKTASGTGFNLIDGKVGCTDGDTTCAAGTSKFTVRGDGQLTIAAPIVSTVTTGTAPFTVASTTNVVNLNASSLNGATFAAPGAIGGGTPNTGAFTTITGTGATFGTDNSVAGTVQVANSAANAHTIWGSGATTSNSINGFATVPTTGHLIDCTVTSTTCLLHDSGVTASQVVTSAASLTSTALMTGAGSQGSQTPSATSTLDASGNLSVAAGGSVGSANTGTPKFTFATNSISANQPLTLGTTSNQLVTGTTTNLTTTTFPASSGAVTVTMPNVTSGVSYVAGSAPAAGVATFAGSTFALTSTTSPNIGTATGTSLYATGIVDGKATVNVSTTTPCTLGTASANCSAVNSLSGYTVNEHATAGTAITYNLPTAAAGLQYCVANGYNGSAANTGILTVATSASGQFIIFTDGTLSATGGNVTSGGAAGDAACFVGVDTTHWMIYVNRGTWTKH